MNTYKAFFNNKTIEVKAESSYEAQQLACFEMGASPRWRYLVTVVLLEKDGQEVVHSTSEF